MSHIAERVYRLFSWKSQQTNTINRINHHDHFEISDHASSTSTSTITNDFQQATSSNIHQGVQSHQSQFNILHPSNNLSGNNQLNIRQQIYNINNIDINTTDFNNSNFDRSSNQILFSDLNQTDTIENILNNNSNNHQQLVQMVSLNNNCSGVIDENRYENTCLTSGNTSNINAMPITIGQSFNNNSVINSNTNRVTNNRRYNRRHSRTSRVASNHLNSNCGANDSNTNRTSATNNNNNNLYSFFNIYKKRERNLLSACCSVFCITILAVSLVETRWFYLNGGGCNLNYVGVAHFFAPGRLEYQIEKSKVTSNDIIAYNFILPNGLVLKNCANREILLIMRTIIAFVFMAIFSSCIGLLLDTFGCMRVGVKLIRRHGIFHILTVAFCLAINGFCFWISERMSEQQFETRLKKGKKIDVSFDVSYYLIVLASGMSILATAFTLIRKYPSDEDEQLERLLEEYTGFEDPIHLERSLPANIVQNQVLTNNPTQENSSILLTNSCQSQDFYFYNFSDQNNFQHLQNQMPILPTLEPSHPSTPPPPLHLQHNHQNANLEPPPPYDLTPAIA